MPTLDISEEQFRQLSGAVLVLSTDPDFHDEACACNNGELRCTCGYEDDWAWFWKHETKNMADNGHPLEP